MKITDQAQIRQTMDAFMREPSQQRLPYIVEIFSREHHKGGIYYEACRPMGATEGPTGRAYDIANTDTGYTRPIAQLHLDKIEHIVLG